MNSVKNIRTDEIAIRELLDNVIMAFNQADLEKLLSFHTEDIILLEPDMPVIQGKKEVRELFAAFQKKKIEMELDFDLLELEVILDRAFVRGRVKKTVFQNGV